MNLFYQLEHIKSNKYQTHDKMNIQRQSDDSPPYYKHNNLDIRYLRGVISEAAFEQLHLPLFPMPLTPQVFKTLNTTDTDTSSSSVRDYQDIPDEQNVRSLRNEH
eukprot:TRINITY_DN12889_c0_g2_i1.p6 TRINITY_DN12889_c0_g2~~TRINITY_DN12889_c0_g2_i1.p6  ORF type:complete len:105 (-),score=1.62 TRINITY_DN12889_c0_g2_i1:540-854(-)